jgi:diacylglycerol kinase (ATP)
MDRAQGGEQAISGLIIANPVAGGVSEPLVADVHQRCLRHLPAVRVRWTRWAGDARRTVQAAVEREYAAATTEPEADERVGDRARPRLVVVAVGGDGTVREVVEGVAAAPSPGPAALLVVPAGTGNSNYLAHWGDLPWPEAVDAALTGHGSRLRRLDLARLVERDELVVLGAASGIVAEALEIARGIALTGRPRYRAAFTEASRRCRPYPGRVTVDGTVVFEGATVFANVGGGQYRGGSFRLLPRSVLDDGQLDVCVVSAAVPRAEVPELVRTGAHVSHPGVVYARGRRIRIERTDGEPLWFEHDGELLAGVSPFFTLTVLPGALPALCAGTAGGYG